MLLLLCILVLLLLVGPALYLARQVVVPRVRTPDETFRIEQEAGKIVPEVYDSWAKEDVRIPSPYGYSLFGVYLPLNGAQRTVIIAHGITFDLHGSIKYVDLFRRRGFNALLIDHRAHGRSGGKYATYGFYERHDLRCWIDWALARLDAGGVVGAMGESYGAAVALQTAAIDSRLAFVIADCAFSDLSAELTYHLRHDYHLPPFPLFYLASGISRLMTGMAFGDVSPLRDMPRLEMPVLLLHGADDSFTPAWMSQALYEAKTTGARKLYLAPGAEHAQAYWHDRDAYDREVGEFLVENGIIPPEATHSLNL